MKRFLYPEYEAYEEKTVETESTVYGPAERTEPFVEPTVSLVSETITEPVSGNGSVIRKLFRGYRGICRAGC